VFRRKHKADEAAPDAESGNDTIAETDETAESAETDEPNAARMSADPASPDPATSDTAAGGTTVTVSGPYDADAAPDDELPRIDLGAMRVPLVEGLEVRLDMDEATGEPTQLVLADGDSMLQLGVFAAPRSSGIWGEVREEIAESLKGAGGSCEEITGALGTELAASVPTGDPAVPFAPARFIGVDRPRWFLRGLLSGPAAVDAQAAAKLELVLRGTVVVRGKDAMPIRDPLPLRLPAEAMQLAQEQIAAAQVRAQGEAPTLEQLEQGPTITETR
jgi:hypothetical protein